MSSHCLELFLTQVVFTLVFGVPGLDVTRCCGGNCTGSNICQGKCYCVLKLMGFHKSTLVVKGANTQLDLSCVSAPPATNVDLFACFAERLFKSSSIRICRAGAKPAIVCMWACRTCDQ